MDNIKLILTDVNNKIAIDISRYDLESISTFFKSLVNFGRGKEKNQSEIILKVRNASIAKNVIMGNYISTNWLYVLETLQCQNYFGMNVDITKLYDLMVPAEGFNMLLETIDELNCTLDNKLKETIKINIPNNYDLKNLSNEFIKELISKKYYLATCDNTTIKIWDASTGQLLNTLKGHNKSIKHMALSSNNKIIASGGEDGYIKIWEISTGKLLNILVGHTDWITCIAFSPSSDGQIIASGSWDQTIKLWDGFSGILLNTLDGQTGWVSCLAFSSNGQIIVSGHFNGNIKIWNTTTGRLLNTLISYGQSTMCWCLAFSPNGHKFVSCDFNFIKIWCASSGQLLNSWIGHTLHITSVTFSPDGRMVASSSWDSSVKLWDVSGIVPGSQPKLLHTITKSHNVLSVAFSPAIGDFGYTDRQFIACMCVRGKIDLWDVFTGKLSNTFINHTNSAHCVILSGFIYDDIDKKLIDYVKAEDQQSILHEGKMELIDENPNEKLTFAAGSKNTRYIPFRYIWEHTHKYFYEFCFKIKSWKKILFFLGILMVISIKK
jgi:WD40 repeat protein